MKKLLKTEKNPRSSSQAQPDNLSSSELGSQPFFRMLPDVVSDNWPPKTQNSIHQIELRSGFAISVIDLEAERDTILAYKTEDHTVGFGCILSGTIEKRDSGAQYQEAPLKGCSGIGGVSFSPAAKGAIHVAAGQRVKVLHVHLRPDILDSLFHHDSERLPLTLKLISQGKYQQSYALRKRMSPQIKSVVHQITNGVPPGVPQKIYLEGKALELISLQMASLCPADDSCEAETSLTMTERKKVLAVREILLEKMEAPPTLKELSNSVNLSINKLERGFHLIFGMSVFDYLRESKLQRARLYFLETDMNVSETAWAIGYTNVSHFGAAYKKRFGILPKDEMKKNRHLQ